MPDIVDERDRVSEGDILLGDTCDTDLASLGDASSMLARYWLAPGDIFSDPDIASTSDTRTVDGHATTPVRDIDGMVSDGSEATELGSIMYVVLVHAPLLMFCSTVLPRSIMSFLNLSHSTLEMSPISRSSTALLILVCRYASAAAFPRS